MGRAGTFPSSPKGKGGIYLTLAQRPLLTNSAIRRTIYTGRDSVLFTGIDVCCCLLRPGTSRCAFQPVPRKQICHLGLSVRHDSGE